MMQLLLYLNKVTDELHMCVCVCMCASDWVCVFLCRDWESNLLVVAQVNVVGLYNASVLKPSD